MGDFPSHQARRAMGRVSSSHPLGYQRRLGRFRTLLRVLAYAANPDATEAARRFAPTESLFIGGISHVFYNGKPFQLRKVALLFFPHRWQVLQRFSSDRGA